MTPPQALASAALAALALGVSVTAAGAATVVVSTTNLRGWSADGNNLCSGTGTEGSQAFVDGPPVPPAGSGSRAFVLGTNDKWTEQFRQDKYAGTKLSDLTGLSYSTYLTSPAPIPPPASAPYLALAVDEDGDGTRDGYLIFEPGRQTDPATPPPSGPPVLAGVWQTWDTFSMGMWRTAADTLVTFADYKTAHASAQIVGDPPGGLIVGAGCAGIFAGSWTDFQGNADAVTVKVGTDETVYDFEPTAPDPPGGGEPPPPPPGPTPGPAGTADLSIAKAGSPDPLKPGDTLTYEMAVANFGPAATTATVTDALPGGVEFVSSNSSRGSCSGTDTVTCKLGEMPRDSSATLKIVVKPKSNGKLTNTATVSGTADDSFKGNNSATTVTTVSATAVAKTAPKITLSGSRNCRLAATGACKLGVKSSKDVRATASGKASFSGAAASASFAFRRVTKSLKAGRQARFTLRVSRGARKAVSRALRQGKRVRAKVRLVVKDQDGHTRTARRSFKITG